MAIRALSGGTGKVRHPGRIVGGSSGGVGPINPIANEDLHLLCHAEGPGAGYTSFNDSSIYGNVLSPLDFGGTVPADTTTTARFGATAMNGGGAALSSKAVVSSLNSVLNTIEEGDIGIQAWVRPVSNAIGIGTIFDLRSNSNTQNPGLYTDASGLYYFSGGSTRITGPALPLNTWSFVDWSRVSGVSRLFVNGSQVGSDYADTHNLEQGEFHFGSLHDPAVACDPIILDEFRVFTEGGNTTDYIEPAAAFTNPYVATSTWNASDKAATVSVFNDARTASTSANFGAVRGTVGHNSGIHQFECTFYRENAMQVLVGLAAAGADLTLYPGAVPTSWGYYSVGIKYNNSTPSAYGAAWAVGDVIGVVYDAGAGTLTFYKNGASQGTAFSSLSGTLYPCFGSGNNTAGFRHCTINTGQVPFKYSVGGATAWG